MEKTTSSLALGLFAEVHLATVRQESLVFKFEQKVPRKSIAFSVYYALCAYTSKPLAVSTFQNFEQNTMLSAAHREWFRARLENPPGLGFGRRNTKL